MSVWTRTDILRNGLTKDVHVKGSLLCTMQGRTAALHAPRQFLSGPSLHPMSM